jgi:predicted amidophosphoribosyltransferase/FMN phosphatase YigB (HAD superfamily)
VSDPDNAFFRGQGAVERLAAFKASTPETAVLTVHGRFAPDLGKQIPHFDARDERLEMVLRFPGLPDAVGGTIRDMQSYNRWLYFGEPEGGGLQGIHYNRLTTADFVQDYREQIERVLGRQIQTQFSREQVDILSFASAIKVPPPSPAATLGELRKIFLLHGRVLFGGALAFEGEDQLHQMLVTFQSAYGVRPTTVAPRNDQVFAFTPERVQTWLAAHPHLLPTVRRPAHFTAVASAAPTSTPPAQPTLPFDLIVFDFDNTLAFTTPLAPFRTPTPASGEAWETCLRGLQAQQEVQGWINTLSQQEGRPRLAVISKAPRWYLDTLLAQCYPAVQWDAVVGHDEARAAGHRYKPDPTLLQDLMRRCGVVPERTLVIGDEDDDMEMAYRAGTRALMVDFYSLATKKHLEEEFRQQQRLRPDSEAVASRDWTYFNALDTLPHAVCTAPSALGDVAAHLALHELPLEAALAGTPLAQVRRDARHFKLNCFSRVRRGSKGLPVTVLGRYFTAPNDEKGVHALPARDAHALTRQILEKEQGQDEVPEVWVEVVAQTLRQLARNETQNLLVTIIPAKAQRPQRLENLLQRVQKKLTDDETFQFDPAVFHFTQDAQSNKTLNAEERAANLERSLVLHPAFHPPTGHTYVVIDDVTTTGTTFLRARDVLEAQGVRSAAVQALAIAKTISFRDRNRP